MANGVAIIGILLSIVKASDASGRPIRVLGGVLPNSLVPCARMLVQATLRAFVASNVSGGIRLSCAPMS
jgi:hypothetical protein